MVASVRAASGFCIRPTQVVITVMKMARIKAMRKSLMAPGFFLVI